MTVYLLRETKPIVVPTGNWRRVAVRLTGILRSRRGSASRPFLYDAELLAIANERRGLRWRRRS